MQVDEVKALLPPDRARAVDALVAFAGAQVRSGDLYGKNSLLGRISSSVKVVTGPSFAAVLPADSPKLLPLAVARVSVAGCSKV